MTRAVPLRNAERMSCAAVRGTAALAAFLLLAQTLSWADAFSFQTPVGQVVRPTRAGLRPLSLAAGGDADADETFSLSNLFGNKKTGGSSASSSPAAKAAAALRGTLEPHPSVRDHNSPLNLLTPGGSSKARKSASGDQGLPVHSDVKSGILDNGLSYVILPNKSPPGRFEAHLQIFSGSGMFPVCC